MQLPVDLGTSTSSVRSIGSSAKLPGGGGGGTALALGGLPALEVPDERPEGDAGALDWVVLVRDLEDGL